MPTRPRPGRSWPLTLLGLLVSTAVACAPDDEAQDGIRIGLLLPFTGSDSLTSANLERAAIYAVDRVNEAGGVRGQRLKLIAADTHSEVERSGAAAQQLLDQGAVVLIGPEKPEIAEQLRPLLAERGVAFVSPLIGAANEPSGACQAPWFRLGLSAKTLGEALAKEVFQVTREATVVFGTESYNRALRESFSRRFASLGGKVVLELELRSGSEGSADAVRRVLQAPASSAVILATSPGQGASFVNDLDAAASQKPKWFLSPLLKSEILLENVAPDALEGATCVVPKIYDQSLDFPNAFSARWDGDQPLEGAYFYYDAVTLTAFAMEKASGDALTSSALKTGFMAAAAPPGESAGWDEVELGLDRLRDGADVYYSGLTGPLAFTACGSRKLGVTSRFVIENGRFVNR